MMTKRQAYLGLAMLAAMLPVSAATAFELKDGDSVVFLGDTLTDQADVPDLVEAFVAVRYPKLNLHFFTSAVRDETATQALERLDRDVLSLEPRPTVAVVQYGLYDAGLEAFNPARLEQFTKSLDGIVTRLTSAKTRVWVVTPMSVDEDLDRSRRLSQANYNEVLSRYADAADSVAKKHGARLLDFYKITTEGRVKEREHNRRFAYTRNGHLPDPIAGALLATELLKAWQAEPIEADITLDWKTQSATITAGRVEVEKTGDHVIALKLREVPVLWPYQPRTRSAPIYWPLADLSHMNLKVDNCPGSGLLLGTGEENERALPMLKVQLEMGLDLARFEPVRSLEPISLLARLIAHKNHIRTDQLWRQLKLNWSDRPELQEAQRANEHALNLWVDGYRKWIRNEPRTFDVTLQLTAIVPENSSPVDTTGAGR